MKTTLVELDAVIAAALSKPSIQPQWIESAFQLPDLSQEIPFKAIATRHATDEAGFAKKLIKAKIIDPRAIPSTATTVHEVLKHGLESWFQKRVSKLKRVRFSMGLYDAQRFADILASAQDHDRVIVNTPALVINGTEDNYYFMESASKYLERVQPGLFKSAFRAVIEASYRTVYIMQPDELVNTLCYQLYEGDWSEVEDMTDEEAKAPLMERFEDAEIVEEYLPSKVIPKFGGELTLTSFKTRKTNVLSDRKLRAFIESTKKPKAKQVAQVTLALRQATRKAIRMKASLPDLCGIYATSLTPGCGLIFKNDDLVWRYVDDIRNDAWNCGEGTEMLGVEQMPDSQSEIAKYFKKLDVAFTVLRHMDKLISLISK